MRRLTLSLLGVVGLFWAVSLDEVSGAETPANARAGTNSAPTNILSIHFAVQAPDAHGLELAKLKIDPEPILADADFVAFEADKDRFTVRGPAAVRLSRAIWASHKMEPTVYHTGQHELIPFSAWVVLKVEGTPIFMGAFWALHFSNMFPGHIVLAESNYLKRDEKEDVTFVVRRNDLTGNIKASALGLRDARIAGAVKKLFGEKR